VAEFDCIGDMNDRIENIFGLQSYNDFSEIEVPRPTIPAKNPGLMLSFYRFRALTIMGYLPRPGEARLWSWQVLLHGCNHLVYFRWRTATKGAEQFCYGVLDHDNAEGHRYPEMVRVFSEARQYEREINGPIETRVALIYNPDNIYAWEIQPHSTGMDVHHEHFRLYQGFKRLNIPVDVIDVRHSLERYSIVLLPLITGRDAEGISVSQ
jgi:beta-galactosidase GanA